MSKTTKPNYKRRNFYIDKDFQAKFILKFCLIAACGSILAAGLIYWMARSSTTVAIIDGHVGVHTTAEYLLPLMVETILIELLVVCLSAIIMTLFVSHKIAGPLFRLKVMMANLGEGDVSTSMHLREDDQLKAVADSYNEAVAKLNYKIKMLKNTSSIDEVKQTLNTFKTS